MLKGNFPIENFKDLRTPFYYYDLGLLSRTLDEVRRQLSQHPDYHMHYAVKANFNPRLLEMIAASGMGADCVSGGEVEAAVKAGFAPSDIFFAGVGKSDEEIRYALGVGIGRFNVESLAELNVIDEIAASMGKVAPVSLRVNPDIGAHTHANITTGLAENKFGINHDVLEDIIRHCLTLNHVAYKGLHFHIGSQILDMSDFAALCNRINEITARLERHSLPVGDINVGGGLGIDYHHPNHLDMADFASYFATFRKHLMVKNGTPVHFELGRSIVAPCGSLICRVLYVKEGSYRQFAIIDG
ncbi:MAG: diaminopimelate decarboxylase, partial [Bacteroidales bacterium]|nr:diaminopimelate decarboxylase [Bacteroidales bacterium]